MAILPTTVTDPNQMLTTAEAAALLGLKPATLANWREDGSVDLAFSKLGSCVSYRYADGVAFAQRARCTSTLAARHLALRGARV
ncbi:MAG: helix-turn-helix domain-containing protein [Hyphomonadaceae bacterium]|nr:helix-turn-helix domain-containing protein [Hyphomonadaceae bacterium]